MNSKPDFIGIGAQKAATNWLWHNLKVHPDVWMPPIKELHYFDRSPQYPSPSYLSTERFIVRLFGRNSSNKKFRAVFTRPLAATVRRGDWAELQWRLRHYCGRYNLQWYWSLFEKGAGKLKGEITPSYSILDLPDVRNIKRVLPNLKVLIILRNPIDRAWSHVRFDWTTKRFKGIDDLRDVKAFIDSRKQELRGDYVRTIETWSSCFQPEQFFIGFYDDVIHDPHRTMCEIYKFLGISAQKIGTDGLLNKRIFSSDRKPIPDELLIYLAKKYRPEIKRLSAVVGGHTNAWLRRVDEILSEVTDHGP